MNSQGTELLVIGVAMIFFLAICAVAVWAFVRQYRRERGRSGGGGGQRGE